MRSALTGISNIEQEISNVEGKPQDFLIRHFFLPWCPDALWNLLVAGQIRVPPFTKSPMLDFRSDVGQSAVAKQKQKFRKTSALLKN